jgi:NADPH-dependent glutamate synthase beta subunit-like oxidoreductase
MTPLVDLTAGPGTGPQRARRPRYVDLLAPCNHACPAGEDIQAWLAMAQAGRFREAWEILVKDNPLPSVHGRVCYHPCESSCNRTQLDSAVGIHAIERFLGDLASEKGWSYPVERAPNGVRVLVVGAGPSGLSAAYHLARLGYSVEIREAGPAAGGMLHFGIPAYRMPRDELQREVARIEAMGVKISLNHRVEDVLAERAEGAFDAVFLAIGAHLSKRIEIPTRDATRVVDAVTLLHEVGDGEMPRLGRRVIVYGAGNTAMDAARTARRLGADDALIVYHRDRAHMSAHEFEAEEALAEGVKIKWLSSIKNIDGTAVTVEKMHLDDNGELRPTGELETLDADAVVLALGQRTESGFLRTVAGVEFQPDDTVVVGPNMMTGHAGIFAGGDMTPSERTVTAAVGHGKSAARHIDGWLTGKGYQPAPEQARVSFEMLHLGMFTDAEQTRQGELASLERTADFTEVFGGIDRAEARYEAQRCLSCGNCFECDQCYAACPEVAIEKLGPGRRYRFDYHRCTGCAVCFEVCPCHAIEMIAEPSLASAHDAKLAGDSR